MCRWVAYTGAAVRLESIVTKPARSLVHQSLHAAQCKTPTNGDGFGLGWYGDRETPGIYREITPAWSDENLLSLCAQLRAETFFAHVRASTGAPTARTNCHPFSHGPWLFMHNGQIGGFCALRRRIENMIPDRFYAHRRGGTDSEAIFLIAMAEIEHEGPIAAIGRTLGRIVAEMREIRVDEPLRFAAALCDGHRLDVFRWSSDPQAPSVWYREGASGLTVVSEPIDDHVEGWQTLPPNHVLTARCGALLHERPAIDAFDPPGTVASFDPAGKAAPLDGALGGSEVRRPEVDAAVASVMAAAAASAVAA